MNFSNSAHYPASRVFWANREIKTHVLLHRTLGATSRDHNQPDKRFYLVVCVSLEHTRITIYNQLGYFKFFQE